ncbi:thioredoxin family protein (plasmid) [Entomospira entomophila]|uniref:Thioredoxin family protein n=1 Tax=Entomospira entomophila TaxID=2719988 RepID=A0A968GDB1_9SPIO|nr:thioredoxin family protein [Entomospira entomophilus]NIZ41483.1 thioredoxin family protein [Entomospira entomophilus]WDI36317.1 thioredoxin family protein [Entomospira entomophilus]
MRITILGTGSQHCIALKEQIEHLLVRHQRTAEIKIENDIDTIATYDVNITPAIVCNGVICYDKGYPISMQQLERILLG